MIQQVDLAAQHCKPCEGGVAPMGSEEAKLRAGILPGWEIANGELVKTFRFRNYHDTMAFVNATAWISHREGHHPDLEVGYNTCKVRYSTHAIGGLSDNDFICAAKVEGLLKA